MFKGHSVGWNAEKESKDKDFNAACPKNDRSSRFLYIDDQHFRFQMFEGSE